MEGLIYIKISADLFPKATTHSIPPSQIPFIRRGKENLKYKSKRKRIDRSSNKKISIMFLNMLLNRCSKK